MGQTTAPQVCRLAVIGPRSRADLCVPSGVPLIDLLPAVLAGLGPDVADLGLEHDGWVLQRLGEEPLDDDRTPADLGLRDGDTLHLRPRADQLPPLDFDDLVDGIGTGVRQSAAAWDAATTRTATLVAATVATLAGAGAVLRAATGTGTSPGTGPLGGATGAEEHLDPLTTAGPGAVLAAIAGAVAVAVLLAVGARLAKGGDRQGGTAAGLLATLLAAATGHALWAAAIGHATTPTPLDTGPARALAAAVTGLLAAAVACAGQRWGRPAQACLGAAGVMTALAAAGVATGLEGTGVAAVAVLAVVAARPVVPQLAFRLAGLRLDPLPSSAEDLQRGVDPLPGAGVLAATARAEAAMTALYAALGATGLAAALALTGGTGWAGPATAAALGLSLVLAARPLVVRWHRAALGVPGLGALALAAALADLPPLAVMAVVAGCAGTVAVVLGSRPALAEERTSPLWGRAGDVAHLLAGAAVVPLALQVLGAFAALREAVG